MMHAAIVATRRFTLCMHLLAPDDFSLLRIVVFDCNPWSRGMDNSWNYLVRLFGAAYLLILSSLKSRLIGIVDV